MILMNISSSSEKIIKLAYVHQFVEPKLVIWCALLRFIWTVLKIFEFVFQSLSESLLAHVGFFLRSCGMMFHSVAEL